MTTIDQATIAGNGTGLRMRVGEAWVGPEDRETMQVINPATGRAIAEVPVATAEDAQLALEAAQRAQSAWAALTHVERARYLKRVAELVHADADRLTRLITLEEGKPLRESRVEIEGWTAGFFEYFSSFARAAHGEILLSAMPARKLAPALMVGNSMVVELGFTTPLSALALAEIMDRAGLPPGLVSVLPGSSVTLGDALVRNSITQLVTLTGSVGVGEMIATAAAGHLAAVSLELGGKAPFVVMDDADVDSAARHALTARFQNNGQVCTCNERTYVHRRIFDRFVERYVALVRQLKIGDPLAEGTDLGPKVSKDELEKVERIVDAAREQGADVVTGGKRAEVPGFEGGFWYEPTVLTGLRNDMDIMQEVRHA